MQQSIKLTNHKINNILQNYKVYYIVYYKVQKCTHFFKRCIKNIISHKENSDQTKLRGH